MKLRIALLLVMFMALPGLVGCGGANGEEAASEDDETPAAVPVEVASVDLGTVRAAYSGTTTLEAEQEADIVAKVQGVVLELLVEEGDQVSSGQVVARLDRERLELQVRQAQATLDKLENDFRRTSELYEKKLISRDAFDKLQYDLEAQKAAVALAELDLSYTDVRAPFAGVISERLVKVGNLIGLHETLFRLDDFDPLLAVLHVPERELNTLRKGQEARLEFDAMPDQPFIGLLERISPVVDPATGTFKVTVAINSPDPRLKPGMFGRVNIVHDVHQDVVTVPRDALIIEDRGTYVYVASEGKASKVAVRTGYTTDGRVEILDDALTVGQAVVTSGKGSIADQTLIEVINGAATIAAAESETVADDDRL